MTRANLRLSTITLVLLALLFVSCESSEPVISLEPDSRFQTMMGWEVTARGWEQDKANNRYDGTFVRALPVVLDKLVNDLGINRIRLEIWSGSENPVDYVAQFFAGRIGYKEMKSHRYEKVNDNNDPFRADPKGFQFSHLDWQIENIAIPMQKLLAARGERLYVNFCYVDFQFASRQGQLSHAKNPEEYAELIETAFLHMKDTYGVTPDALEIILEPENTADWGSKSGRRIGPCLVAAVDRLRRSGFSPAVLAPSCKATDNALRYFDSIIEMPGVRDRLSTLTYHRYGGDWKWNVKGIGERAERYNLSSGMSERLGAGVSMLLEDLTLGRVSFWQQWSIAELDRDRGYSYLNVSLRDPENPKVELSSRSRVLQQYFRYVRLGAVRIGASSNASKSFAPVAFVNPSGQLAVIVKNDSEAPFSIKGLPAGAYRVSYSGPSANHASRPPITISDGETLTTSGDRSGAVTIFGPVESPEL